MVVAGGGGQFSEFVDKRRDHFLERALGCIEALLKQPLLLDHIAQVALRLFDGHEIERPGDDLGYHTDLAAQPLIVGDEFTDVVDEQSEQL